MHFDIVSGEIDFYAGAATIVFAPAADDLTKQGVVDAADVLIEPEYREGETNE